MKAKLSTYGKIAFIVEQSWTPRTTKSAHGVACTSLRRSSLGHPARALDWVPRITFVFPFFARRPSTRGGLHFTAHAWGSENVPVVLRFVKRTCTAKYSLKQIIEWFLQKFWEENSSARFAKKDKDFFQVLVPTWKFLMNKEKAYFEK